jgi:hypothetical protein
MITHDELHNIVTKTAASIARRRESANLGIVLLDLSARLSTTLEERARSTYEAVGAPRELNGQTSEGLCPE